MSLTLVGQKINQYTITERKGSSVSVYLGWDEKSEKEVIIKATPVNDQGNSLLPEIRIGSELSQKCMFLLRYEEIIIQSGQLFAIMEYFKR